MIDDIFQDLPNYELYGYGSLEVGEVGKVDLTTHKKTAREIQTFAHAYGQYTQKKFKTKALNDVLYIKRVK